MTADLAHLADARYRQQVRRGHALAALLADPDYRPTSGHRPKEGNR